MDTKLGEQYSHILCDDCKAKVERMTSKLSKWSILRPNTLALKFQKAICKDCKKKLIKEMKQK